MLATVPTGSQSGRSLYSLPRLLVGCTLIWLLFVLPIHAQATPKNPVTADQVGEVARELWCPLCSGVRLDTCELQACEQMRQEIALKLQAGENLEAIKKDFLTQYGPQVLGEPPRSGFNWLAWILPFVVLLGGAIFLVLRGRTMLLAQPTATAIADVEPVASPAAQDEPYARQLEEELKQYD